MIEGGNPVVGDQALVQVRGLVKHFPIMKGLVFDRQVGAVHAVDGISFDISAGETFGMVGESGCGKTTAGRTILGLYPSTAGTVTIGGITIQTASQDEIRQVRRMATIIFQDPFASLNPRWTVNSIVSEPIRVNKLIQELQEDHGAGD